MTKPIILSISEKTVRMSCGDSDILYITDDFVRQVTSWAEEHDRTGERFYDFLKHYFDESQHNHIPKGFDSQVNGMLDMAPDDDADL